MPHSCFSVKHIDISRPPYRVWVFGDNWLVKKDTAEEWPYAICSKGCMHIVGHYKPMNEQAFKCAENALCNTDEGREAFSFIRSRLTAEGYDEHYFDAVYRKSYCLQDTLEDAERIRNQITRPNS